MYATERQSEYSCGYLVGYWEWLYLKGEGWCCAGIWNEDVEENRERRIQGNSNHNFRQKAVIGGRQKLVSNCGMVLVSRLAQQGDRHHCNIIFLLGE